MPIARGEDWGVPGSLPNGAPVLADDADAAALVRPEGEEPPTIGLCRGDLARTLGVRAPFAASNVTHLLPVDALRLTVDGESHTAVAHAMVGHPLRAGEVITIMNAAFVGKRNVAPRAHPGDGKADVLTFRLAGADRLKAWRRMLTGTHLPHPDIATRQKREGSFAFAQPEPLRIDGKHIGRVSDLSFWVQSDALRIGV